MLKHSEEVTLHTASLRKDCSDHKSKTDTEVVIHG